MKYLPYLREIGVSSLKVDDIEVLLRPQVATAGNEAPAQPPGGRDPTTMGLPNNVKVPSLRDRRG